MHHPLTGWQFGRFFKHGELMAPLLTCRPSCPICLSPPPAVESPETPLGQNKAKTKKDKPRNERDLILNHEDAQAASPDDMAACGEEDVGAGLEFLVTRNDHDK